MSATQAAAHEREKMELVEGETLEELAERLFNNQMEVYSAHMGSDIETDFYFLRPDVKQSWLRAAQRKRDAS